MAEKESQRSPRAHRAIEADNDILDGASGRFRVTRVCLKATHRVIFGSRRRRRRRTGTPPIHRHGDSCRDSPLPGQFSAGHNKDAGAENCCSSVSHVMKT